MKFRSPWMSTLALTLGVAQAACSGSIGTDEPGADEGDTGGDEQADVGEGGSSGSGGPAVPSPKLCASSKGREQRKPVEASIRRLSWAELAHVLTDLFPGTAPTELEALTDASRIPERSKDALASNETFVRTYHPAIAAFAQRATTAVMAKQCADGKLTCLEPVLLDVARRAWRMNLGATERTFLTTKLAAFAAELGPAAGFTNALRLVLGSPRLLYLLDPGSLAADAAQDGAHLAKGDRLAGLLAAALWASVPDAALLDASAAGRLDAAAGLAAEVDRMLGDPRARRGMTTFFRAWLRHNLVMKSVKDAQLFPGFDDALRAEMLADTESTLLALVFDEKKGPDALLTSPLGHPGPKTIAALGWKNVAAERTGLERVGRIGVATHPSVLALTSKAHATSIVNRGRFFVERLACEHVPDPPPNVDVGLEEIQAASDRKLSARELAEKHSSTPACASCHKYLDPFGMVFEGFDPIGRQRTEADGLPVNLAIKLDDVFGLSGEFAGPAEVLGALAKQGTTDRCFTSSFASFVLPSEIGEAQGCSLGDLTPAPEAAPQDRTMLGVVRKLVLSDLFRKRAVAVQ